MLKTTIFALGISLAVVAGGCQRADEPQPDPSNGPQASSGETGEPSSVAEIPPLPECQLATDGYATATGPRIRITLNANGSVNKIEGMDEGNWQAERTMQETRPESLGSCLARIEIHALNDSTNELVDSTGGSLHSHANLENPPYNTHCHRWVKINNVNYLVHC